MTDEDIWAFCIDSNNARLLSEEMRMDIDSCSLQKWARSRSPIDDSYRLEIAESIERINRRVGDCQAERVANLNQLNNRIEDQEDELMCRFHSFLDGYKNLSTEQRAALSAYVRSTFKELRKRIMVEIN